MKNFNGEKIYKNYNGLWVALTDSLDKVISADRSAKKVHADAVSKGYKEPILFKVPKRDIAHIG